MKRSAIALLIAAAAAISLMAGAGRCAEAPPDALAQGFANPPHEARPGVFWWWLESQATKAAITRDLEQLKAKGFVRLNLFDAGSSNYQVVERTPAGPVFGSKEWIELFVHALKEADRLGIEITTNICSGWNPGGPSVKVEDAMKHLVWSETVVTGPAKFDGVLEQPKGEGYRDVMVQAFKLRAPAAAAEEKKAETPKVTASSEQPTHPAAAIVSERGGMWVSQEGPSAEKPQWLQLEFAQPVAATEFYVQARPGYGPREFELLLSHDGGKTFESAGKFKLEGKRSEGKFSMWPVKAKVFRLSITTAEDKGKAGVKPRNVQVEAFGIGRKPQRGNAGGITRWQDKTLMTRELGGVGADVSFLGERESGDPATAEVENGTAIDLSAKMDKDGRLAWEAPQGKWVVVRYGHAHLPSAKVSTGGAGWQGYSYDHLDSQAVRRYLADNVEPILAAAKPYIGRSLKYLYTDSWEMGSPNWTVGMMEQFKKRRGYDPAPWLPALTGRVVGSRDLSNRFLHDFRKTVGEMIRDEYYVTFANYAKERGLLGTHCEAGGPHGHPVDGLACFGLQEFMQGEFWPRCETHRVSESQRYFVKQPASAAHIYGKTWVAAEGPTTIGPQWERPPRDLKDAFDKVFCEGLNRLYWHTFTCSPQEFGVPGNEYFAGTHLNPNATWWEQSGAVVDYIARCSWMLSRGRFVADAAVFVGEDTPVFGTQKHEVEGLGAGFDYDDCNAETILTRMSVKDGFITLPDGMRYRLLMLPRSESISVELMRKIAELVRAGATVMGPKPATSSGLAGYPESEAEVKRLADEVWGPVDGLTVTEHACGKGRVFWGKPAREILAGEQVGPDFQFKSPQPDTWLDYIHRQDAGVEIYYVINRLGWRGVNDTQYRYMTTTPDRYEEVEASFRVEGAAPELWDPLTGRITKAAAWREEGGRTILPLRLAPYGSAFVVFRKGEAGRRVTEIAQNGRSLFPVTERQPDAWPALELERRGGKLVARAYEAGEYELKDETGKTARVQVAEPPSLDIDGPWAVRFDSRWGGPEKPVLFDALSSWTDSEVDGIRYYSGAATYVKEFEAPAELLQGKRVELDLGNVLELAEVTLNGKRLGVVWIAPYRLDVTGALESGRNRLEVKVVNLWPNRLIGDAALPAEKRLTRTNVRKFTPEIPLRPSGLLGPVRLVSATEDEVRF